MLRVSLLSTDFIAGLPDLGSEGADDSPAHERMAGVGDLVVTIS